MEYEYQFPVIRGVQAKKEYYITMIPLRMLSKLFRETEDCVTPEHRA